MKEEKCNKEDLVARYLQLVNHTLPAAYTFPVSANHCFARIVLDWLFSDCWYHHLCKEGPAYRQLNEQQLEAAIERMAMWLHDHTLLISDNKASLAYRKKARTAAMPTLFDAG